MYGGACPQWDGTAIAADGCVAGSILALVDFSEGSHSAFKQASRIADAHGSTLHVLHVVDTVVLRDLADALGHSFEAAKTECRDDCERNLAELIDQTPGGEGAVTHVMFGAPLDEVRRLVKELKPELVVLGTYGSGGPGRGVGTLASQCVRRVNAEILLVPQNLSTSFAQVVACVDFSDVSKRAVEVASRFATQNGATLTVLHVFQPPWRRLHYRAPTPQANPDFKVEFLHLLESRLRTFAEEAGASPGFRTELLEYSSYGGGIVEFSQKHHADLVVLGTRGRTNLRYVLLGSTAERVIRDVHCGVLAVKPNRSRADN